MVSALLFWGLNPKEPNPTGNTGYEKEESGYYPGGANCQPDAINRLPWLQRLEQRESCADAREQHRLTTNDLIQQRRSADAADAMAIMSYQQTRITLWGLIFGVFTLTAASLAALYAGIAATAAKDNAAHAETAALATIKAADAAVAANELQRTLYVDQHRAHVSIVDVYVTSPLTWNPETHEGRVTVQVTAINNGDTTAKNCIIRPYLKTIFGIDPREFYSEVTTYPNATWRGFHLEARQPISQEWNTPLSENEIQRWTGLLKSTHDGRDFDPWSQEVPIPITLFVVVSYQLVFGDEWHHTGVCPCARCARDA